MWSMIEANLPALQVVLPMLAAPLCAILKKGQGAWALAFATVILTFAVSVSLFLITLDGAVISYRMGNWAPPIGIEYRVDILNAFVLLIVSGNSWLLAAPRPQDHRQSLETGQCDHDADYY